MFITKTLVKANEECWNFWLVQECKGQVSWILERDFPVVVVISEPTFDIIAQLGIKEYNVCLKVRLTSAHKQAMLVGGLINISKFLRPTSGYFFSSFPIFFLCSMLCKELRESERRLGHNYLLLLCYDIWYWVCCFHKNLSLTVVSHTIQKVIDFYFTDINRTQSI